MLEMVAVKSQAKFQIYGLHIKDFEGKDQGFPGRLDSVEDLWKICAVLPWEILVEPAMLCDANRWLRASSAACVLEPGFIGIPTGPQLGPKPDGASKCSYFSASINLNQKKPDRIVTLVRPSSVSQGSQVVSPLFWLLRTTTVVLALQGRGSWDYTMYPSPDHQYHGRFS